MVITLQFGKYELLGKLATGGMAEVFFARATGHAGFEKTLVLKRILPHLAEDPTFIDMFLAEARLAVQLNHPSIVQIFDFGEVQGAYFLAMEHIDGPNLGMLLERARAQGQPLAPALCARLIALACEGLAFAHDFQDPSTGQPLGLLHRDINPDNILVSRQGAVKVVDFGIAKAAGQSHKTQSGVIKGKLAYMPPEQVRAKPLDRRVDVYALGVVLYELLTGRKPFEAPTDASLMQAILSEPLLPAAQLRPDLTEPLQHILERALARERAERYPDCRALQADLEDFIVSTGKAITSYQLSQLVTQLVPPAVPAPTPKLEDLETEPFMAEEPSGLAPAPRPTRAHRPWMTPALVGAALLIAGGGYLLGMRSVHASEPLPAASATLAPPAPPSPAPERSVRKTPGEAPSPVPTALAADHELEPADKLSEERAARVENSEDRRPPARRNRAETAPSKMGTLHLNIRGWADIWIDGQKKGRVPPINDLELPPGRHRLKLVNPSLPPYETSITVAAGETLEHTVTFSPPAATAATR